MGQRDTKIDEAKIELQRFFNENAEEVFYIKQIEVLHEKKFFHWIISRAINELISEDKLKSEFEILLGKTRVKFIFNKKYRYYKRDLKKKIEIIRKYSQPEIAKACGRQAEVLFLNALTLKGFRVLGENTNEFMGRKWRKTSHNLDFIIEKDNIHYACEVKNTFDYIDKNEMFTKLDICKYLGITPLFIMRFAPKNYIWEIAKRGAIQ